MKNAFLLIRIVVAAFVSAVAVTAAVEAGARVTTEDLITGESRDITDSCRFDKDGSLLIPGREASFSKDNALPHAVIRVSGGKGGFCKFGKAFRVDEIGDNAMAVAVDGATLYCLADDSLYSLDATDPNHPRLLGRLRGMDNRRQLVVRDGFAYVVSRETGMRVVDVRDPRQMKLCSRYDSVEFATGIDVVGKTAFLSERIYGVEAVDVSDPYNPRHICLRKTDESQSNLYRNGYLYSGEWGSGSVTIFDAHDMSRFKRVGVVKLGGQGDGLDIDGRYLYCSTGHDARNGRAKGGAADIGSGHGLEVYDLADPVAPKFCGRVDFPVFKPRNEDFWTVRVCGNAAFCCDSHNGFFLVDVRDKANPKVMDRFCVPQVGKTWPSGAISSCAIGKGCVYVTSFPGGLWVVPFSDARRVDKTQGDVPINGDYRETYGTDGGCFGVYRPAVSGQCRTVCVKKDVVYAAFGDAGLHVLRLLPDGGFEKLGELPGNRRVTDCCFVGEKLVTAEGVDGWGVYELEGADQFREVGRRRTSPGSTVAFWCWSLDHALVVLSSRNDGYKIFDVNRIDAKSPLLHYFGTCLWDKYLPDGALNGRYPTLAPYRGLTWIDVGKDVPEVVRQETGGGLECGNQCNGVCVFDRERFLYTVGRSYRFLKSDMTMSPILASPTVPAGLGAVAVSGIPRSDGKLVVCSERSVGRVSVWDFADEAAPRLLATWNLSGRPDVAVLHKGRVIIPAGHEGLLISRHRFSGAESRL